MKTWRSLLVLTAAGYAAACATAPAEVPAARRMGDVSRMKGEWLGEYHSSTSAHEGLLVLRLDADADSAWGSVWMTARNRGEPDPVAPQDLPEHGLLRPLSIRFLPDNWGFLSGKLQTFFDPELGCPLITTFRGHFEEDALEGTFLSEDLGTGQWRAGTWRVERSGKQNGLMVEHSPR